MVVVATVFLWEENPNRKKEEGLKWGRARKKLHIKKRTCTWKQKSWPHIDKIDTQSTLSLSSSSSDTKSFLQTTTLYFPLFIASLFIHHSFTQFTPPPLFLAPCFVFVLFSLTDWGVHTNSLPSPVYSTTHYKCTQTQTHSVTHRHKTPATLFNGFISLAQTTAEGEMKYRQNWQWDLYDGGVRLPATAAAAAANVTIEVVQLYGCTV